MNDFEGTDDFDPTNIPVDDILEIDLGDQKPRETWKAGDYEFIVSSVSVENAKSSGRKQLVWILRFPSVNNWTIKHYTGLDATGVWSTEQIIVALGLGKAGEKVVLNKRQAIGRRGMAKIKLDEYNGKQYGKVDRCFPHPKGAEAEAAPF